MTPSSVVEAALFTVGEASLPEWQLEKFPEYRAARALNALAPPTLFAVGVTGNVMTLLVLTLSELRHTACCKYLAAVALTDTMVLILNFCFNFVDLFVQKVQLSDAACKLYYFLFFTSAHLSSWLLVAVTAQRCLVICRPMTSFFVTSNRCTVCVIGGLTAASVLLNSHHMVVRELVWSNATQQLVCHARGGGSAVFVRDYWPWVDAAVYSFLPAPCLVVFNTIIIRTLRKAAVFRKRHQCHQGHGRKLRDGTDCAFKPHRNSLASASEKERPLALAEVSVNPPVLASENARSLTVAAPVLMSESERPRSKTTVSVNSSELSENERSLSVAAVSVIPPVLASENECSLSKTNVSVNPSMFVSESDHVSTAAQVSVISMLLSETEKPLASAPASASLSLTSETEHRPTSTTVPLSSVSVAESEQPHRSGRASVGQQNLSLTESSQSINTCIASSSSWTIDDRPQPPTSDTASKASQQKERQNQSRQLTLMPLLASLLFVTLSAPIAVTLVLEQLFWQRDTPKQVI